MGEGEGGVEDVGEGEGGVGEGGGHALGAGDPLASLGNDSVAFLLALLEDQDLVRKRSRPPPPHPPPPPPLRIIEPFALIES